MTFLAPAVFGNKVKSKTPEDRSYATELNKALDAQIGIAPKVIGAERAYRPVYNELNLDSLNSALYGGGAGGLVGEFGALQDASVSRSMNLGRQYGGQIADIATQGLLPRLTADANAALDRGYQLDPYQSRQIEQGTRGAQAARGFGYGANDVFGESLALAMGGERQMDRARAYATDVAGMNNATIYPRLETMAAAGGQYAANLVGAGNNFGQNLGPTLFQPESQYLADLANQAWQGKLQTNQANAANQAALISGGMQADSNILSSL
jgi:hypothetical protein